MSINGIWPKKFGNQILWITLTIKKLSLKKLYNWAANCNMIPFKKNTNWKQREVQVVKENIISLPGPPIKLVFYRFGNAAVVGTQGKCNLIESFWKPKMCVPQYKKVLVCDDCWIDEHIYICIFVYYRGCKHLYLGIGCGSFWTVIWHQQGHKFWETYCYVYSIFMLYLWKQKHWCNKNELFSNTVP